MNRSQTDRLTSADSVLVGIDVGGSFVKAVAVDIGAGQTATASMAVGAQHPVAGHHERDPDAVWLGVVAVVRAALASLGAESSRVASVAVTAHGNGAFLVDRSGVPTYPAVQAADLRAAELVAEWSARGVADDLRGEVWNDLWPGQPGPILAWLAVNEPDVLHRSSALLMCGDYVRARLTNSFAAELTSWSCNGLVDSQKEVVSDRALALLGIERYRDLIPPLIRHDQVVGHITFDAAEALGVPAGVPVTAGVVDNVAVQVGAGVIDCNRLVVGAGTWSINQLLVPRSRMTLDGPLGAVQPTAACLAVPDGLALMIDASATSASTFGWAIDHVLRGFGHDATAEGQDVFPFALAQVEARPPSAAAPFFLPYLDGSSREATVRGAWVGLASHHNDADLARATIEGVCFEHRRHVERLSLAIDRVLPLRLAGGVTRSAVWAQTFADAMGRSVEVTPVEEQGAIGAVVIGGSAVGVFDNLEAGLSVLNPTWQSFNPDHSQRDLWEDRYQRYLQWADLLEQRASL